MTKRDDGGPAFPEPERFREDGTTLTEGHGYRQTGMTLRDWFAGQALVGLLADTSTCAWDAERLSGAAYVAADAMLAERRKESTDD